MTRRSLALIFAAILMTPLVSAERALALETGCHLQPSQIEAAAVEFQKQAESREGDLADLLVIHSGLGISASGVARGRHQNGASSSTHAVVGFDYEAFVRPTHDDFFAIPGFPLLGARLSRHTDVVYICAHGAPQESGMSSAGDHITVYFLHGKDLGPESLSSRLGNLFIIRDLHVAPVQVSIFAVGAVPGALTSAFDFIPVLNIVASIPVAALTTLNRALGQTLALVGGAGVERITVTPTSVELASLVNLQQPRQARILATLPLLPSKTPAW